MTRYALVREGRVENVIEAGEDFEPDTGVLVPDPDGLAEPGGSWNGAAFAPAPDEEPGFAELLPWQFQAVVDLAGLRATAEAAIAAIADPVERTVARSRFLYSRSYRRDDPLFVELADAAGLQEAQVDDLWRWGEEL